MSRRPISLSTYLAAMRGAGAPVPVRAPRGDGPFLWVHASEAAEARALGTLLARLATQWPEIVTLRTGAWDTPDDALPPEAVGEIAAFLDHWRPDLALWSGLRLHPALLWEAADRDIPLLHVDPGGDPHNAPGPRWLPDTVPPTLALFDTIFLPDAAAERRLPRVSLGQARIRRSGALTETTLPLDCNDDLLEEALAAVAGRPVWLAAHVRGSEARLVIEAHRRAARLSHRLLLALVPETPEDAAEADRTAATSDLRLCRWDEGEMPDDTTQVVLCGGPEDIGLWYRLAPLAFLGGSLAPGHGGTDPFEAAALGTAILYGPNVGRHLGAYSTLVEAGAARIVRDEDSLSGAVSQLLAPDRAAAMAHAGWDIVSRGAAASDAVIDRIIELLEARREAAG
ncbi:3-deoxy-D-manno-octulosonic acid transferase [Roseivivax jejudonensis]|uniref:3-deoxy-D-manno-octulosonic acid transferase n=1 Tax=Roseivivax jejudonensis TaxID=1529041 RepID=A0A1X7A126_9RHOB|nr:glycosyltransferase N-terminal domain-containing protein [Roseivivax jejudonensis]SLN67018.1 3-deoxy-D-manno-octulosonic acid transferase [Roseivivax jejudonensis]